jgi:hypothetical protein
LHCPRCSPFCRSSVSRDTESFRREPDPLQSLSPPFDRPTWRAGLPSSGFACPSTAWLARAPCGTGCVGPIPVPLAGFLNLSAVSQQTRVSGPCFMPQPFLGHLLQGVPLTKIALTPLEAASSLAVIHRPAVTSQAKPCHRRFPRRPRLSAQLPGSPDGYELPFHGCDPASRSPWTSRGGAATFGQLHLLRSFDPSVSPFRRPGRTRSDGRYPPGLHPLWGISSQTSESSDPPEARPRKETNPCACRPANPRTMRPSSPGETAPPNSEIR